MKNERGSLQDVYRAKRSFGATFGDQHLSVKEGDLVRAGHPLLALQPDDFELAPEAVRFDIEQATARPGEER